MGEDVYDQRGASPSCHTETHMHSGVWRGRLEFLASHYTDETPVLGLVKLAPESDIYHVSTEAGNSPCHYHEKARVHITAETPEPWYWKLRMDCNPYRAASAGSTKQHLNLQGLVCVKSKCHLEDDWGKACSRLPRGAMRCCPQVNLPLLVDVY